MATPRIQRKSTFLWQGLLILLPVAVLAVVGVISLRQDKILARHDAAERAQAIADDFLQKFSAELTSTETRTNAASSFAVDQAGGLIFPPAWNPLPTPKPFNLAELNTEQAQLWETLQIADADTQDEGAADQAFTAFIKSHPPEDFAGAACYAEGLRLMQQEKLTEAVEAFALAAEKYPNATGESGLPLAPLARLKLFEILPHPQDPSFITRNSRTGSAKNSIHPVLVSSSIQHFVSLDDLCSNIVCHPTPLSPYLLECVREYLDLSEYSQGTYQAEKLREQQEEDRSKRSHMPHSRARFPKSDTQLMETEKFEKWQRLWQDHEMARGLYKAAHGQLTTRANVPLPGIFWFTTPYPLFVPETSKQQLTNGPAGLPDAKMSAGGSNSNTASNAVVAAIRIDRGAWDRNWLALETGGGDTNAWFICHRESKIASRLNRLLAEKQPVPDYLGVGVEIAGRKINTLNSDLRLWHYAGWNNPHSPDGGEKKEYAGETATNILASAAESQAGEEALRVNVYLTSPSTLYRRQGARTFWFGSLVAVSAAAALIGLLTAWQAFRQQRQLNEMKSNFVSSVSHELRAPIASVRLMAENLEGGKISEPQKQREYFGFIVQECRRLTSLIENVLDFSRIEQGRKQYEFEPTDVAALVRTTVKLMEPNAAEKGVALKLETFNIQHSTPNIEVKMDGRAVQQALVNLIDNAIKHSPKGETVTVGMEVQSPTTASVSIEDEGRERGREKPDKSLNPQPSTLNLSVTDHGPGIPPEEHEKIFERFYRRGSELRRETQGVGIGLSIVKHIVTAHGGRVRVESRAGQGSRFTIELPLEK